MLVYKRELKKNMKSLIIWGVVIGGLILMTLSIFPQFSKEQETMTQFLDAYPEEFKKAFSMDRLDLGTIVGYYGMQVHMYTTLLGSLFAVMLSSNIIAKEENEKTIEFLLSKPVSRARIVAEKAMAVVTNILLLNGVIVIISLIGFQFADERMPFKIHAVFIGATILIHLTFAAIAFLLSAVMKKSRTITAASLGVVFISYILSIMSGISEDLDMLKYISVFKYVDAPELIADQALSPLYLLIMTGIILLGGVGTFLHYNRKDIAS
ncbi:ABC transporter permease subunit [Bacillus sp. KH172YL63]|uniref:ABC transporter permease subunit n=1 Tax=Bacillus sp. KH172YL63 TaxID=2709784 RepID=UPI001E4AC853|nr:ABC transporter permease subunit [Bacillus sp. KH172YL63]